MSAIPSLEVSLDTPGADAPAGVAAPTALEANDGNVILKVVNPTANDYTVTAASTATFAGIAIENREVVVVAGGTAYLGPFPPVLYNDDVGRVGFTDNSLGALLYSALRI